MGSYYRRRCKCGLVGKSCAGIQLWLFSINPHSFDDQCFWSAVRKNVKMWVTLRQAQGRSQGQASGGYPHFNISVLFLTGFQPEDFLSAGAKRAMPVCKESILHNLKL